MHYSAYAWIFIYAGNHYSSVCIAQRNTECHRSPRHSKHCKRTHMQIKKNHQMHITKMQSKWCNTTNTESDLMWAIMELVSPWTTNLHCLYLHVLYCILHVSVATFSSLVLFICQLFLWLQCVELSGPTYRRAVLLCSFHETCCRCSYNISTSIWSFTDAELNVGMGI